MSRIIGCEQLHIAEVLTDTLEGTTFGTPKAIPSLISIDISDQTENITFYSDNTTEQVIPSFSGKEVSIELGYLTNELEALISGNEYKNGLLTQSVNATAKEYALLFRAPKSKGGYSYVCLYKGVLAREEANYKTKEDSIESSNVTLSGVFMPLVSNGKVSVKADSDEETPSTLIKNWFTKVPVEDASSSRIMPKSEK